jgi:plasmid maintenance system antidote protein VapI
MQLLNSPSKNKSILNLGIFRKDGYGIYDISQPAELLSQKLMSSGMKQKDLAILAGVDETTLYRHLKGTIEISREIAIKYAKALGCDPVEILFNNLNVPIWGTANTLEMNMLDKFSVLPSEITALNETRKTGLSIAQCPREIYRPDIKAIKIKCEGSVYNNHVAYYYNSVEPIVFEDEMVIVGTKLKNYNDSEVRLRYFIGIYKKNKNGKTIDLHSIDPDIVNLKGVTPDEDFNSFDDVVGAVEQDKIVLEDFTPEFVAPIVSLVQSRKIYDPIRSEVLKAYDKIYTKNRKDEIKTVDYFKKLKLQAALRGLVADASDHFDKEDWHDNLRGKQVKAFMKTDKRFQSILSKAAYGPAKSEKKIELQDQVKKLNIELSAEEEKIVQEAADELAEQFPEPPNLTPEEAGQK